jgi:FAD/FMN-containing dehydrogenase
MTTVSGAAQSAPAALASQVRGQVTGPDSPDWDTARTPWNRRIDQRPLLVADAERPDDIAATAAWAASHGFQVTVQAPWATGTTLPSFADPGTDTASRVFPPATRKRLAEVKHRYDPANVFRTSFPVTA